MKFIRLNKIHWNRTANKPDYPIWINIDQIVSMTQDGDEVLLALTDGNECRVRHKVEDIINSKELL